MPNLLRITAWAVGRTAPRPLLLDVTTLAVRAFAGLAMALAHGWGKIPVSEQFLGMVERMGLPFPLYFAWAAALTEVVGGLALAVGLATRAAAAAIVGLLVITLLVYHAGHAFEHRELALLYLALAAWFAVYGGGRYSADQLLRGSAA